MAVNIATNIEAAITAHAGGGAASAYQLTKQYNQISVCAAAGDSVMLPAIALTSLTRIWVRNDGLYAADVFPPSVDIDGGTTATAVRIQPGQEVCFTPIDADSYKTDNMATVAVSQATNISTGVTCDSTKGVITTQAASAGASGATPNTFTVTCKYAEADSNISLDVLSLAGTGNPVVRVNNRLRGSFDIVLSSCSAGALNGVHIIGFEIKN